MAIVLFTNTHPSAMLRKKLCENEKSLHSPKARSELGNRNLHRTVLGTRVLGLVWQRYVSPAASAIAHASTHRRQPACKKEHLRHL